MTRRERFGREYGVPLTRVNEFVHLGKRCALAGVHVCNGDPYTLADERRVTDKNDAASLWQSHLDRVADQLAKLAAKYGFEAVTFDGLYPNLKRDGRTVFIPY